jgi:hypothetical protein
MLAVHYAPRTPLTLITGPPSAAYTRLIHEVEAALSRGQRVGVLALPEDVPVLPEGVHVEVVGEWAKPEVSATRLFGAIRSLDSRSLDVLLARELADPSQGLGRALSDRLRRASQQVLDTRD